MKYYKKLQKTLILQLKNFLINNEDTLKLFCLSFYDENSKVVIRYCASPKKKPNHRV